METSIVKIVCLLVTLHVPGVTSSTLYQWVVDSRTRFNYDPDRTNMLGVYNWPRTYSESCGGRNQSPVDIQTNLVRYGVSCQCPTMLYTSNILKGKIKNNGHTAEFEPETPMAYRLTNIPYRTGTYYMHDFHLHYGGVTGRNFELQGRRFRGSGIMSAGSEHTLDGTRFEGELHFVFHNNKYKDLQEADDKPDGVVVIVILVQKIPDTAVDNGETSRFSEFLTRNIPPISPYQQNYSTEVDMAMFFNRECEFYTYRGSTTTPLCHESVRWLILREPIRVTERAWFELTGLVSRGDFNSRFGNYRTTQPLNDRVIEANFMRTRGPVLPMPVPVAAMMMTGNMTSANMPRMADSRNALVPNLNRNPVLMSANMNRNSVPVVVNMPRMSDARKTQRPSLNGSVRGSRGRTSLQPMTNRPSFMAGLRSARKNNSPTADPNRPQAMSTSNVEYINRQNMNYSKRFNMRMRNVKPFTMVGGSKAVSMNEYIRSMKANWWMSMKYIMLKKMGYYM